ncbi:MAG TPA: GreA/GreB family elongation factor [Kofleriaceae bacterium]|nr:GreA/GreB family elongation factor [Kofleriaceae bacterium]
MTDKGALRAELLETLRGAIETARAAHAAAVAGAIDDEARPENDKDTRGLEQSYLARGQAQRVAELEVAVNEVAALALRAFGARDRVALGALVTVEEEGRAHRFFVAPHGGGTVLADGTQVVTPVSPLGRALLGRHIEDEVEVRLPGKLRSFAIAALA